MATYVWMSRQSLECAGVRSTYNATNEEHQEIFLHSVQEEFYENFSDLNDSD